MNDILFGILEAVIVAAVAAVARYLIPYIKERLSQSKFAWLADVVDYAVRAVEQMFKDASGAQKKAEVEYTVNKWCNEHHINIRPEQLNHLIEASVNVMNTEFGKNDVVPAAIIREAAAVETETGDDGK